MDASSDMREARQERGHHSTSNSCGSPSSYARGVTIASACRVPLFLNCAPRNRMLPGARHDLDLRRPLRVGAGAVYFRLSQREQTCDHAHREVRMSAPLHILQRVAGGIAVFELNGHLVFAEGDRIFRDQVKAFADAGGRRLLVDLSGVSYVDSGGIGSLVEMYLHLTR